MNQNNDSRSRSAKKPKELDLESCFKWDNDEIGWQKMLSEKDPKQKKVLYKIYSQMICS